jgi:hypothetical protein
VLILRGTLTRDKPVRRHAQGWTTFDRDFFFFELLIELREE